MTDERCGKGIAGDFCALPAGHTGRCNPTRRLPEPTDFELRIPLPGDIDGIVMRLPRPMTPEQWEFFTAVLGAMRAGIVVDEPVSDSAASDTRPESTTDQTAPQTP